jgi:mono/diheme cytochrome c family protein
MRTSALAGLLALAMCMVCTAPLSAAPTAEQSSKATSAEEALKEAGKLIIAKKHEEAVPLVEQAQNVIAELQAGNAEAKKLAAGLEGRLAAAKRALEGKGIKLADPVKPMPGVAGVSFTKEIAPILVGRCNNCHIMQTRGGFNMANFNALLKGSDSGRVIFPGKSNGSRLIEVLDSGDMPRGGGKLQDAQIELIAKWIDQGARFDGKDPTANISEGLPTPMPTPTLQVAKATGNESVSFARDIAPVLAEQCIGCHGANQPRAQLSMDTMRGLLRGSMNGLILAPGKGAESLIVRKLKGQAGERMPQGRPKLPDEVIAKFEKWVNEGAKFDGSDANMNVDLVAKVYRATVMTHSELAAERATVAAKNWQLANPDDRPDRTESDHFLVVGNVSEDELAEVKRVAEQQEPKVARLLRGPASGPLVKGRITFFVFRKRYDYSELGRMVEGRELPARSFGHFRYNVVDAYAGIVMPQNGEVSLPALVAEQLAGIYIESIGSGNLPQWFSQGTAWAVAASVDGKDPRVHQWDNAVLGALAGSNKADDFLTNGLPPAENAVAAYGFCKYLMSMSKSYNSLLSGLKEKKGFEEAFLKAYGADPKTLAGAWALKVATSRKR